MCSTCVRRAFAEAARSLSRGAVFIDPRASRRRPRKFTSVRVASLARFPPVPMLGAVASYRRGGPRPPLSRGASHMSAAPALHHFIKTLGLLRQLGEIDEVVPLLRHDQDSRSPSKSPGEVASSRTPQRFCERNPCIFLGRLPQLGQFVCGMTHESSDGSECRDCFLWSKQAASSPRRSVRHLHKTRCSRRYAADATSKNCNPCERQLSNPGNPQTIATLLQ